MKKHYSILFILSLLCLTINAQITIVKDKKPISRIVVNKSDSTDRQAAELMVNFAQKISGAKLEIVPHTSNLKKGDIVIGDFQLPANNINKADITEDGFTITTDDGYIRIIGNEGKGSIYAAVAILDDYFGVHYFAQDSYLVHPSDNMMLKNNIRRTENPSFRYRQTQAYSIKDPIYKLWHRLEEPKEVFADNLWVHTFNHLLPAAEFGEKHPEYYSFISGQRRPGTASQWCLTNTEVFDIVAHRLDSIFKKNPDKHIISVSQNDSQTYCHCDKCKAINEKEGTPAGTNIYFLNKLAEKFPDKEFSTLAYLYSVPAPKHIKPLPNVNIMLCDIDCYREVTLTENPSGKVFVTEMEKWAKITNNIFVWDYGINFDNYVSPFPNFHILQPNMRLFKENGTTMHFSQIAGSKGGDFSELRSYIVAKLLWNVDADVDGIMKYFISEYYGEAAAPYIYDYIKLREGALMGSNIPLWIYDTPVTHKEGMLNKAMTRRYKALFDQAEAAVSGNSTYLKRVREARLPIQYAELEILRTEPIEDAKALRTELELFRSRAKEFGVENLNERSNKVEEYCDLYIARNLSNDKISLARNAKIEYLVSPNPPYDKIADKALTDGLYGGATFNEGWVGWLKDAEFVIDLGQEKDIQSVEADFLHKLGAWILLPKNFTCYTSLDNKKFDLMGHVDIPEDRDVEVKYVNIPVRSEAKIKTRYIKVKVGTIGLCPPWHYGVGNPAWFFMDEVNVY